MLQLTHIMIEPLCQSLPHATKVEFTVQILLLFEFPRITVYYYYDNLQLTTNTSLTKKIFILKNIRISSYFYLLQLKLYFTTTCGRVKNQFEKFLFLELAVCPGHSANWSKNKKNFFFLC